MLVDEEDEELLVGWEDAEGVLDAIFAVSVCAKVAAPIAASRDSRGLELKRFSAAAIAVARRDCT